MGKYTSLAKRLQEEEDHSKRALIKGKSNNSVNSVNKRLTSPPVAPPSDTATPLRGNAVNAVIACIHDLHPDRCAVCNGYARWLIAGGAERIQEAGRDPAAARRRYWRLIE
jgi:hypothetical protein